MRTFYYDAGNCLTPKTEIERNDSLFLIGGKPWDVSLCECNIEKRDDDTTPYDKFKYHIPIISSNPKDHYEKRTLLCRTQEYSAQATARRYRNTDERRKFVRSSLHISASA